MAQYFRLGNPGISSISFDGREHIVNEDGLLEVRDQDTSAALTQHIHSMGGRIHAPEGDLHTPAQKIEEDERQILFAKLDVIAGRRIDRRRSLAQLQEMLADHEERQRRTEAPKTALIPPSDRGVKAKPITDPETAPTGGASTATPPPPASDPAKEGAP
jgi:hypothetical protein